MYLSPLEGSTILGRGVCAIIVADDDPGTILYASQEAEQMFRAAFPGEFLGLSVDELVPLSHKSLRTEYNKSPRVRRMGLGKPLNGKRRDGTTFPVEVELRPERDNISGKVLIRAYLMNMEGRTAILPMEKS